MDTTTYDSNTGRAVYICEDRVSEIEIYKDSRHTPQPSSQESLLVAKIISNVVRFREFSGQRTPA